MLVRKEKEINTRVPYADPFDTRRLLVNEQSLIEGSFPKHVVDNLDFWFDVNTGIVAKCPAILNIHEMRTLKGWIHAQALVRSLDNWPVKGYNLIEKQVQGHDLLWTTDTIIERLSLKLATSYEVFPRYFFRRSKYGDTFNPQKITTSKMVPFHNSLGIDKVQLENNFDRAVIVQAYEEGGYLFCGLGIASYEECRKNAVQRNSQILLQTENVVWDVLCTQIFPALTYNQKEEINQDISGFLSNIVDVVINK